MSMSRPNTSRTLTVLSGAPSTVWLRLSGWMLGMSLMVRCGLYGAIGGCNNQWVAKCDSSRSAPPGSHGKRFMQVFGFPLSPFVRKVHLVAAEKGIEVEMVVVDPRKPDPDFLAASPFRKIPALKDGDYMLADLDRDRDLSRCAERQPAAASRRRQGARQGDLVGGIRRHHPRPRRRQDRVQSLCRTETAGYPGR
ncbi:hypothetical protein GKE62_00615 [Novosphingobium sp. Gsoil 351]|nr:hypothetical protein GKE62_00615 [Novosphingobium sp. Gsoil 351]